MIGEGNCVQCLNDGHCDAAKDEWCFEGFCRNCHEDSDCPPLPDHPEWGNGQCIVNQCDWGSVEDGDTPADGDSPDPEDGDSVSPGDGDGDAIMADGDSTVGDADAPADADAKDSGCGAGPLSVWWPLAVALLGLRRRRA
ncbi:MAG: hypothetical protein C4523_10335 [Myxococcales bacterium]|nr:MAG: hypothetical protein C4523_10335 [Myxococcales bacterium]